MVRATVAFVLFTLCVSADQSAELSLNRLEEDISTLFDEAVPAISSDDQALEEVDFPVDVDMRHLSADAKAILGKYQRDFKDDKVTWEQYFRSRASRMSKFTIVNYLPDTDLNCFGYALRTDERSDLPIDPAEVDISKFAQVARDADHKFVFYFAEERPILRRPKIQPWTAFVDMHYGAPDLEILTRALQNAEILDNGAIVHKFNKDRLIKYVIDLLRPGRQLISDTTIEECLEPEYADGRTGNMVSVRTRGFVRWIEKNGEDAVYKCSPHFNKVKTMIDDLYERGTATLSTPAHVAKRVASRSREQIYEGLLHSEGNSQAIVVRHRANDLNYASVKFVK